MEGIQVLKISRLLLALLALAAVMAGCSNDFDQTGTLTAPNSGLASAVGLQADGDIQSATLYVYVNQYSGHDVQVHRITSDWDEMTVTWNNFGGAFDPTDMGAFTSDDYGWKTADVTGLVQGWLDGDFDNFGLLLKQGDLLVPRTHLASRETEFAPMLEICYASAEGPVCTELTAIADASIFENYPNDNTGAVQELFIGWYSVETLEKQCLIRFDLPTEPKKAALGDFVWYDDNQDGIQDDGEMGIAGVTVELMDCNGTVLAMTMTDAAGYYLFDNLEPGDYMVHFIAPDGLVFSPMDAGDDDAVDSDADRMTGLTVCTNLEAGETDLTWDAGLYEETTQEGCTLTIGFWKTHAGFGPQADYVTPLLPIWLGDGTGKSLFVDNATMAHAILAQNVYGHQSNGITKLYAQLLAAKLNIAHGASSDDVSDMIADADAFLANHDWTDWGSLTDDEKTMVLEWKSMADDYNNGLIGPGHCDSFDKDGSHGKRNPDGNRGGGGCKGGGKRR